MTDDLTPQAIDQLIACYDHYPAVYARLTPETTADQLAAWQATAQASQPSRLERQPMTPNKTHLHFTGRDQELAAVQRQLTSQPKPLVALIGLGGMGKTTLALEAIAALQQRDLFETVVWTSAKYSHFVGEGIQADSPPATAETLEELIDQIANQAIPTATSLPPDQKRTAVAQWLADQPTLIVLDNFESVAESVATPMLRGLHEMLGAGRVLITSRHRVKYEPVSQITLTGLSQEASLDFLRHEAQNRQVTAITQATRAELSQIYQACGGQPLAMRLVVGQLSRLPWSRVAGYLQDPKAHRQTYDLYKFIYQVSWEVLSHNGRELLVALGAQPPTVPMFADDLEAISELPPAIFDPAIDELLQLSLVEVEGGLEKQYRLHPLTYQFVKSEITKEW